MSTIIRVWLPLLLLLPAVSGCRSHEKAVRTEYRYIHSHDSVRVEKWDTVRIEIKGDTVRIFEHLHEIERVSTVYRDTLRQSDTLRIERVAVKETTEKPVKRWRWFVFGAFSAILGIILIEIIRKYAGN